MFVIVGKTIKVIMDRPLGSKHPKHDFKYPINYGYVPNTISGDGKEIDVYVLGVDKPLDHFEGECIAIVHRNDHDDDKLVVVPAGMSYSDKEIMSLVDFQEKWFDSLVIR